MIYELEAVVNGEPKAYIFVIADSEEEALRIANQDDLDFHYIFGVADIIESGSEKGVFEVILTSNFTIGSYRRCQNVPGVNLSTGN